MGNQFKPGDPALVIGGDLFLGESVEIVKWVNPGDIYHVKGRMEICLDPKAPHGGWAATNGRSIGVKIDRNLMPLRGNFEPERQKAREAEPCA